MKLKLIIIGLDMMLLMASCTEAPVNTTEPTTTETEKDVLLTKGVYIGRIDPSFIEVETINGFIVFKLHMDEEADYIEDLMDYTAVDIEYVLNSENQNQIRTIVKADEPGIPLDSNAIQATGTVAKYMDNHVIVVESEEQQAYYWIPVELYDSNGRVVEIGDHVIFSYYIDNYGRNVVLFFDNSDQGEINPQYRIETGRYNGISNDGILEIKITGVPDTIAGRQYIVDDNVIQAVDDLDLMIDDVVRIHYYINEAGDNVLVDIEKM
ncbi:MAG: hypothetical protein Q8S24_10525 [Eubacteriales bacterium]|nr:hypothetical protein [Eubacteriales bacterium]